jgi:hypothetical protein
MSSLLIRPTDSPDIREGGARPGLRRRLSALAVAGLLGVSAISVAVPSVAAYGNAGGAHQTYQIMFSSNCNNPTICTRELGGLGGFWGWAVLYSDGTGDAELTGCGHMINGGGPGTAGAGHFRDDFTYDLADTTELVTLSEMQTFVGHGQPVTKVGTPGDTGFPLTPGHYDTTALLGFSAPGVSFMVQVVALH